MNSKVSGTIQQVGRCKWETFVESHPHGSIYHSSRWHEVIRRAYGYQAIYHVVLDVDGKIRSGLPCASVRNLFLGRRFVSFPYSDFCDPLIGESEDLETLLDSAKKLAVEEQTQGLELRTYKTAQELGGDDSEGPYCNFVLSMDRSPEDLFSKFHKSCVQRAILKAERGNLKVSRGVTLDALHDFYRLHVSTRRRQGVPVQPFRFLKNLWDEFASTGQISLLLAQSSERVVAAILLLEFKDTLYYKFGASDPRFLHLRPNQLLFWKAIQDGIKEGYRQFELGRTSRSNKGLVNFKQRWGALSQILLYISIPSPSKALQSIERNRVAKLSGQVLRLMPECVTRCSGRLLYRYLG